MKLYNKHLNNTTKCIHLNINVFTIIIAFINTILNFCLTN